MRSVGCVDPAVIEQMFGFVFFDAQTVGRSFSSFFAQGNKDEKRLNVMKEPKILVHCQIYRVVVSQWSEKTAVNSMWQRVGDLRGIRFQNVKKRFLCF